MKKIFYIVALALVSSNIMAATDAACYITLTSEQGGTDVLKIFQDPATTNEFVSGADITKFMNSGNATNLNIYSVQGTTNVSQAVTNDVEGLPVIIQTNQVATNYTMTFSNVQGTLYLFDSDNGTHKLIADGESLEFTAAVNETLANRFSIKKSAVVPTSLCFRENQLEINGHAGETLVIASKEGLAIEEVASLPATYSKDLSGYNGRFVVTLNGVHYQIDVNPAVTAVP